ncbi:MAG: hypothetical protein QG608_914 [Actinomycetota bacterium]|nr:hypothetical protein [Actinomycetota bacterium]
MSSDGVPDDVEAYIRARGEDLLGLSRCLVPCSRRAESALLVALRRLYLSWGSALAEGGPDRFVRQQLSLLAISPVRRLLRGEITGRWNGPARGTVPPGGAVLGLLRGLPPHLRVVLVLRFREGLTRYEIAQLLRVPTWQVDSWELRGCWELWGSVALRHGRDDLAPPGTGRDDLARRLAAALHQVVGREEPSDVSGLSGRVRAAALRARSVRGLLVAGVALAAVALPLGLWHLPGHGRRPEQACVSSVPPRGSEPSGGTDRRIVPRPRPGLFPAGASLGNSRQLLPGACTPAPGRVRLRTPSRTG